MKIINSITKPKKMQMWQQHLKMQSSQNNNIINEIDIILVMTEGIITIMIIGTKAMMTMIGGLS